MSTVQNVSEFFDHDIEIKQAMMDLVVNPNYMYDQNYLLSFENDAYRLLKYIFSEFYDICDLFYNNNIKNDLNEKFKQIMDEFIMSLGDADKLQRFYQNRISDIRPSFMTKTSQELFGFYLFRNPASVFHEAKTINELLHAMHSDVINNDNLYVCNPLILSEQSQNKSIKMYGVYTDLAQKVFDIVANSYIATDSNLVISFSIDDNKVLVMTRDLGHATSFEISRTPKGDIRVSYFIPKICDVNMVNSLKGINKIPELQPVFAGATGVFYTNDNQLEADLSSVIKGIPSDINLSKDTSRNLRV